MSGGLDVLQMKEEDVLKFLAAGTHLGCTNLDFQMEQYVYKRKSDGKCREQAPRLYSATGLSENAFLSPQIY